MSRRLIVTADDFGMSIEVNEAVEEAHLRGVLTCASLVVTGAAAADAVDRAHRMPRLGVGLHLALVAAPSALAPSKIPALIDVAGRDLAHSPVRVGVRIALSTVVREQARAEIKAQLQAWRATGLPLDHVDGHWHFHQHPAVVNALVEHAADYRIRAVRIPYEPPLASWHAAGQRRLGPRLADAVPHRLLGWYMRRVFQKSRITSNDWFFGKNDGGHVTRERLLGFLANLPPGVSEIGLHPATQSWAGPHAPPADWQPAAELAALTDPDVAAACRNHNISLIRFGDLVEPARTA